MNIDYGHEVTLAEAKARILPEDQFLGELTHEYTNRSFRVKRRPGIEPLYVVEKERDKHYTNLLTLHGTAFAMVAPAFGPGRGFGAQCVAAGDFLGTSACFHNKPNGGETTLLALATNKGRLAQVTGNRVVIDTVYPQEKPNPCEGSGKFITAIGFNNDGSFLAVGDSQGVATYYPDCPPGTELAQQGYNESMKNVKQFVPATSRILGINDRHIGLFLKNGATAKLCHNGAHNVTHKRLFRTRDADVFIVQAAIDNRDTFLLLWINHSKFIEETTQSRTIKREREK